MKGSPWKLKDPAGLRYLYYTDKDLWIDNAKARYRTQQGRRDGMQLGAIWGTISSVSRYEAGARDSAIADWKYMALYYNWDSDVQAASNMQDIIDIINPRLIRCARNMRLADVADFTGVSISQVSRYERGQYASGFLTWVYAVFFGGYGFDHSPRLPRPLVWGNVIWR